MAWFFPDEATPFTEGVLDALAEQPVWVPSLWVLECANVLQTACRRARIDAERRAQIASELAALPLHIDLDLPHLVELDRQAASLALSAYDACYLALAVRRSLTLVTLDGGLRAAAQSLGHPVLTAPAGA